MMYSYLIHQLLIDTAAHHPEQTAIESGERQLSYRELDQLTSQLASTLRTLGVHIGERVALHLDKSPEAVIAMLGVLKAGAVYVPVDSRSPLPRAATILADCGVRVVIGSRARSLAIWDHLPPESCVLERLITVEPDQVGVPPDPRVLAWPDALTPESVTEPGPQTEQDLAYILYTSGSTGTPKGVMISHRAAMSFINWAHDQFGLDRGDRVLSQAPFHFDLSIFDLFVSFKAGATLVLPPPDIAFAPADYGRFLDQAAISVFYATPAILTTLISHGRLEDHSWRHLRLVLFAGDVMPPRHLHRLMQTITGAGWFNLYGPTETNVCTFFEVTTPPSTEQTRIPIGWACANFELMVVNAEGEQVEDGQEGELWVRGPGLMTGYWGRAQQSAEAFAPNPLQPGLFGDRFYLTGDRVRRETDGNLTFLGRLDNMIKTRGYRVEPEEIERLLLRHPQVAEAAVVPVHNETAGTLLKAVVAHGENPPPGMRELQRLCAQNLPDYMIPRYFDFIDTLPKTSTGKLDRTLLRTNAHQS